MNHRGLSLGIVLLLLLALGLWLGLSGRGDDAPPTPAAPLAAGAVPAAAAAAGALAASTAPATVTNASATTHDAESERTAVAPAAAAPGPLATVRGRCVDEHGAPVAGCRVHVHGWTANSQRMDAWRRDHPEPEWKDPATITTLADGTFVHTFWPPPPFQFTLDIDHDERASMAARWHTLAEGKGVDVGDVVMVPGIRVQGRVLDEAGKAVEKVSVRVQPGSDDSTGNRPTLSPVWSTHGYSGADGRFVCKKLLPAGPFRVHLDNTFRLTKPIAGTLVPERPVEELTLVVTSEPKGPTLSGKVVDEAGQPIRNARIEGIVETSGRLASDFSRRDGTFVLEAREPDASSPAPLRLTATHDEFEPTTTAEPVAWGKTDVVLTMRRAGGLAIHVHDEEQRPLTDFVVRVAPRESNRVSSDDHRVRTRGPYEAGFATVPGVPIGKWTVVVEFATKEGRAPVFTPIEVAGNGGHRIDVRAPKHVTRMLRLVDGAGAPVAGSKVQLCALEGGTFDANTRVMDYEQFFGNAGRGRALRLAEATTDAGGTAPLVGPPGVKLGVAALGPGHVPLHCADVRLDLAEELVLTVALGARLRGRVGPPEAVAELRRLGGEDARDLSLQLIQADGGKRMTVPSQHGDERFSIAADGTFDIGGLPPGSWQVAVYYWVAFGSGATGKRLPTGVVTLTDGATTGFDPDIHGVLPGTLRATVQKNGVPLADAQIQWLGTLAGSQGADAGQEWVNAKTGADGRVTTLLRPGVYRCNVTGQSRGNFHTSWECAESATIVVGQTTEQVFTVWTGTLQLTVRDGQGAVVPNLELIARRVAANGQVGVPTTDGQGQITVETAVETLQFRVLPKRLQSQEARRQLWQELVAKGDTANKDPFGPHLLDLGSATVVAGQTVTMELTLPAEWSK